MFNIMGGILFIIKSIKLIVLDGQPSKSKIIVPIVFSIRTTIIVFYFLPILHHIIFYLRNYIHADRGDMPAERQVTWRGCARDWITSGGYFFKLQNFMSQIAKCIPQIAMYLSYITYWLIG